MATIAQAPEIPSATEAAADRTRLQAQAVSSQETEKQGDASALVPVAGDGASGPEAAVPLQVPFTRLPVDLLVAVPVRNFRVRNLLGMEPGSIYETQWGNGEDLPLNAGNVQIAWVEFEVVDTRLAVRVTRLA